MAEELIERVDRALEGLLTKAQCRSLQYHAERGGFGAIAVVVPVVLIGQFQLFSMLLSKGLVGFRLLMSVVPALLGLEALAVILVLRWRNRTVFLRMMHMLRERGVRPHSCLHCEYDLKGSVADHCPECGTGLAPVDADSGGLV